MSTAARSPRIGDAVTYLRLEAAAYRQYPALVVRLQVLSDDEHPALAVTYLGSVSRPRGLLARLLGQPGRVELGWLRSDYVLHRDYWSGDDGEAYWCWPDEAAPSDSWSAGYGRRHGAPVRRDPDRGGPGVPARG